MTEEGNQTVTPEGFKIRVLKSRIAEIVGDYEERLANYTLNIYQLQQENKQLHERLEQYEVPETTTVAED